MCILHLHYLKKITSTVCHTTRRQWGFKWPAESRSIETKLRPDLERVRSRRAIYLSLTHSLSLDSKVIRDQNMMMEYSKLFWFLLFFFFFCFPSDVKIFPSGTSLCPPKVKPRWCQNIRSASREWSRVSPKGLSNPLDIFCKIIYRIFIWCLGYVPCKFYLYRFMAIRM